MDVNRPSRIAVAGLLISILSPFSFSQAPQRSNDPAAQQRSAKPQDGFVDFTLKRINPSNKDYGRCVDEARALIVEETVRTGYFWSNVAALGLLGCLLLIIIFQHRFGIRREWATAEILAQFEHSLQRSNTQAEEAIRKNHAFKEALASLRESALQSPLPVADRGEIGGLAVPKVRSSAARTAATNSTKSTAAKATVSGEDGGRSIAVEPPPNQMALFKSDAALIMKVNSLEQQLTRSEEQQKELRRQLNEAGRKLQAEQAKNRALKGA
jgi:hypothetical protein